MEPVLHREDARYCRLARVIAVCNFALGLAVLVGRIAGIERLADLTFDGISMKANTALALACAGASLFLLIPTHAATARRAAGRALACVPLLLGALTLTEHVFGWDAGIDQLIASERPGEPATVSPGRMGPPASTSFLLVGAALLLLHETSQRAVRMREGAAFVVLAVTLLSLVGNLNGAAQLYAVAHYTGISRQTALALFAHGLALLCARPYAGRMADITAPLPGAMFLRRLLVPAVAAPAVLGWMCVQAMQHDLFDAPFGLALLAVSLTVLLVATAASNSRRLDALSLEHLRAEQERERLLESERHARGEMERAARLKDEFLATLSHELRTPLSAILGWAYVLRSKPDDAELLGKGVEVIERNARHQSQLIDDLLDMSRIASGKMRLDMQPVELPAVVEAAAAAVRPQAEQAGITLRTDVRWSGQTVRGDAGRLRQIVWNLLSNAVKFTPAGGNVDVELSVVDRHAKLTVTDTGRGIAAEFLPHVFDRFRQANSSITREHGGLGIGLAIVKQLVDMHGGTVAVQSDGPGLGCRFRVELPLVRATTAPLVDGFAVALPRAAAADNIEFPALRGMATLVLDDEADTREIVARLLTDCGAVVTCAADADEAMRLLQERRFDVLVSDIGLPQRNGYELIRDVRAAGMKLPAVALTAYARIEDRQRALDAGFQRHVPKPVDPTELLTTISSLL